MAEDKKQTVSGGLVQGAFGAAMARGTKGVGWMGAGAVLSGLGQKGKQVLDTMGAASRNYNEFVENVINNGQYLSEEQTDIIIDELQAGKNDFIVGDKKSKLKTMKSLNELAAGYSDFNELVENVAILADSDKGLVEEFKTSTEGQVFLDAVSGKYRLVKNPDKNAKNKNQLGVDVDGEWISINQLKDIATDNSFATDFADITEAMALKQTNLKSAPNMANINFAIAKNVRETKQVGSLVFSQIIPGRVFFDDMLQSLMRKDYAALGLNEDSLKIYAKQIGISDKEIEEGITMEEANNIGQALISNDRYRNQLNAELTDYYSTYVAQQNRFYQVPNEGEGEDEFVFEDDPVKENKNDKWEEEQKTLQESINEIMSSNKSDEEKTKEILKLQEEMVDSENRPLTFFEKMSNTITGKKPGTSRGFGFYKGF
tara:strand:+ start:890 stop:2176 length:1287 start_codon:yes stop_codon:yes gene_type:complete